MLLDSERHIDRRRADVSMIMFTVQLHAISTETKSTIYNYLINLCYAYAAILEH